MSSFADRSREMIIEQLNDDPRIGGDKVISAAALMRGSFIMLVLSGLFGAFIAQAVLGATGLAFGIGLVAGYLVYAGNLLWRMGKPRYVGVMAALTDKRFLLLGSKRVGIVGDWKLREVDMELLRRGNIFMMGKLGLTADGESRKVFFIANRKMGHHLFESYQQLTGKS